MQTPTPATPAEKLQRIILPDLEFRSTTFRDAIEFLRQESRRLDVDEADPSQRGVAVWMDPAVAADFCFVGPNGEARRLTITFSKVPLGEVIRHTAQQVGLEMHVTPSGVFLCVPPPTVAEAPPVPTDSDEIPLGHYMRAAEGYLELGMQEESAAELGHIVQRIHTAEAAADWPAMEAAANFLCQMCPDQAAWPVTRAKAMRHLHSLEAGLVILYDALLRFPDEAEVHFHLACSEAQLDHLDTARDHLASAIQLMPGYRELALAEPDLAPLRRGSL